MDRAEGLKFARKHSTLFIGKRTFSLKCSEWMIPTRKAASFPPLFVFAKSPSLLVLVLFAADPLDYLSALQYFIFVVAGHRSFDSAVLL